MASTCIFRAGADGFTQAIFAKQRVLQALTSKIFRMEQQVLREILDAADVVCTTCMSAASAVLNVADFPVVFIDEASMSTEPASLVPLMEGVSDHGGPCSH